MIDRLTQIGDLSVAVFLQDYWQQKPLLVKNAFPQIYALAGDELAGFACEEDIESRLIIEKQTGKGPFANQWQVEHGPFNEASFAQLPETHWTLLVQAVNQLSPELHQLLQQFRFIPNWRLDDLMMSYAAPGGSVGPHFDYYDVFLIQAEGTRLWKLGQACDAHSPQQAEQPLQLLSEFKTKAEYLVEPGDLLYIPPGIAHWGVAQDHCSTYSIGFRAPSEAEMLLDLSQEFASTRFEHQRFSDAGRSACINPGEIAHEDIARIKQHLSAMLADEAKLVDWFGRFMTQTKRSSLSFEPESEHPGLNPSARACYFALTEGWVKLFINGETYTCTKALAQALCNQQSIDPQLYSEREQALIQQWIEAEFLL